VELSVCLDPRRPWADQRALAVGAEQAGFAGVWVCDHFMPLPGDDRAVLEGWTSLTALAAATDRLRLGTLVLGAGYRHPAVVASMAATLDHVSGGRVVLGLGAGWQENEHTAYGIPLLLPPARLAMFEEYVVAVRSLLRDPVTDLDGEYWTLRAATCEPKPVQPVLPVLVGGAGRQRTLRVAARLADQWHVWGPAERFAEVSAVLDERCAEAGRDPATVRRLSGEVVGPDLTDGELARLLAGYRTAGADEFVLRDHSDLEPQVTLGSLERATRALGG
jgi:probable F420-dependent oxidoreductase